MSQVMEFSAFLSMGRLPWWLSSKESACQCRRHRFDPWIGKILWTSKQPQQDVWEDAGVWIQPSDPFDMRLSCLGPMSCVFLIVSFLSCSLVAARWQVFFPESPRLTSTPSLVAAIADGSDIWKYPISHHTQLILNVVCCQCR